MGILFRLEKRNTRKMEASTVKYSLLTMMMPVRTIKNTSFIQYPEKAPVRVPWSRF